MMFMHAYLSRSSKLELILIIPPLFLILQQVHTQPVVVTTNAITTMPSRAPKVDGSAILNVVFSSGCMSCPSFEQEHNCDTFAGHISVITDVFGITIISLVLNTVY